MSQEFTDEELDAFEAEMQKGEIQDEPEVAGDENVEPEVQQPDEESEAEQADDLVAGEENNEEASEADDKEPETNPETEIDLLEKYLKDNPLEAKSKSARYKIDNKQKLQEAINKALDYHKKTAELAKWREDIEVISAGGLTKDDLILLAEAKKGSKEAIAALAQSSKVDLYEVTEEDAEKFVPTQHYPDATELEINAVAEEISSDPVVANQFAEFIPDMHNDFKQLLNTNPAALRGFVDDIRNGVAQKVYGEALAHQAMHGGDFLSHYQAIGRQMFSNGNVAPQQPSAEPMAQEAQQPVAKTMSDRERDLRSKAAATTKRSQSSGKSFLADAKSIWDMSEEEFDNLSSADMQKLR
jgi:hypothetical protein